MKSFSFLLLVLIFANCTTSKKATAQKEDKYSDSLFFSMERTPCYGKCATYKLNIYQSGFATFEATRNVPEKEGVYRTSFTKEEMKLISDKAMEIKYFSLESVYDSQVTDLPSVVTTLNLGGKKKSIKDRHHSPPELRQFEKFAEEIFMQKNWER